MVPYERIRNDRRNRIGLLIYPRTEIIRARDVPLLLYYSFVRDKFSGELYLELPDDYIRKQLKVMVLPCSIADWGEIIPKRRKYIRPGLNWLFQQEKEILTILQCDSFNAIPYSKGGLLCYRQI